MDLLLRYIEDRNPALFRVAADVQRAATELWSPPQAPWFTDHGPGHARRLAVIIEQIVFGIPEFMRPHQLTTEEAFVLVAASFLHDIAMQQTKDVAGATPAAELLTGYGQVGRLYEVIVRFDHPQRGYEMIRSPLLAGVLGLRRCPTKLRNAIAEVALSHGHCGYLSELQSRFDCGLRIDLLGALLQIGDILDLSGERINPRLWQLIHLPPVARAHWIIASMVSAVTIDSHKQIHITYEVPQMVYDDVILAHAVRKTVERDMIAEFAKEPLGHLKDHYDLELRLPFLDPHDFSATNDVMCVNPTADQDCPLDIGELTLYVGQAPQLSEGNQHCIQQGQWPDSTLLCAVIRALVAHAQIELRNRGTKKNRYCRYRHWHRPSVCYAPASRAKCV